MKDFRHMINNYLLDHKKQKKYLAVVLALSILVTFAVPLSLMQPAESMTIDRSHLAEEMAMADPSTLPGTTMLDLTSADTWSVHIGSGDDPFFSATQDGATGDPKLYPTAQDPLSLVVDVYYKFDTSVREMLLAAGTGPHLALDLGNSSLTTEYPDQNKSGTVTDPEYMGGNEIAGNYWIENGVIKITLTQGYLNYVCADGGTGKIEGSLYFSGNLSRSEDADGDQSFTMAGQQVIVDFPDRNAKLNNKTANINYSNGTVEWTIIVDNSNKVDMTGYTLTDEMLKKADNVTFEPADTGTHTKGAETIQFTGNAQNAQWITIKYTTDITKEQMDGTDAGNTITSNTAKLTSGEKTYGEKTASVTFDRTPVSVSKNGKPDYEGGQYNGKINWTLTVTNNYGIPLTHYIIEDPKLTADAKVSDGSNLSELGDNKWELNSTSSSVTITYTTDAEAGRDENGTPLNPNTAIVYYPDGNPPRRDNTSITNVFYKTTKDMLTLDKGSSINSDGTITWKLVVNNQYKLNLKDYTLTDQMLGSQVGITIPEAWVNGVSQPVAVLSGDTLTFTDASAQMDWITITYKTKIEADQLKAEDPKVSNTVRLDDPQPNNDPIHTDTETVTFNKPVFTVTKSAKADYENGSHDGKINWSITINSVYGVSLDGFYIEDAMIPSAGAQISPSGTLESENGKWKITGTNGAKTITINYTTENAVGGTEYSNTANLLYPDNTTNAGKDEEKLTYKSESELISIGKSGWYNQDLHEANWTININVQGGLSLNGYVVTDDAFPQSIDEINFNPAAAKNGAVLDPTNGTLTFGDYKGSVTLSYKTPVDVSKYQNGDTLENGVGIGPGPGEPSQTTVGTVNVAKRDTMTKTSNQGSTTITNNKAYEQVLNWTANITLDDSFTGETYRDTLKQPTNGSHVITDAQLAALQITARKEQYGASTTLVSGTDYTWTRSDDGKSFTITFNGTLDTAGYNHLTINYSTTAKADAPAADASYPVVYVFGNSAQFNETTDDNNDWTLTRNNPEKSESMKLTVEKNWQNDIANYRPSTITTKVLYKTNNDGEWRELKQSGNKYLYYTDAEYAAAQQPVTITLDVNNAKENGSNVWTTTLENLRKSVTEADENGNPKPTVYYYYKIQEVLIDGNAVVNELYETTDGFYKVGYTNNGGINYDGTVSVYNTFYKNRSAVPKKNWTGDTGSGTGIDYVVVQLEYSTNGGGTRYPVMSKDGEYIFDAGSGTEGAAVVTQQISAGENNSWTGTAWENLPTIVVENGTAKACSYYIKEIAVKQNGSTEETPISGDRFITGDGYYNVSSSVGNDGSLSVTNEFKKSVSYTIGATKKWEGDIGSIASRPEVLLIQLQQSANWGTWTPYGDNPDTDKNESIQEISVGNDWACSFAGLPNQLANADGTVTTYRYRIVEVGYKMHAGDATAVMFPENTSSFATDTNGVYNIGYTNTAYGTNELSQSGTVTITNCFTPVTTLNLTPQKKWSGDAGFEETDRPQSITFTLQCRLGYGGTWDNVKENGNDVTVTLQNDANTTIATEQVWNASTYQNEEVIMTYWNAATLPDLPAEVITRNADGTYSKQTCFYRFVETSYVPAGGGNSVTIDSDTTEFKTENGKYTITVLETYQTGTLMVTNTFEESIGIIKTIVDSSGNKLSTIEKEDLVQFKRTIGDVDYYVFNWIVEFESGKADLFRPISDQLPDGFTLVYDDETYPGQNKIIPDYTPCDQKTALSADYFNGYFKHPIFTWPDYWAITAQAASSSQMIWEKDKDDCWYYYDKASNAVYINRPFTFGTTGVYIGYATKIECEKFDKLVETGTYTIKNRATKHETDGTPTEETASASLKIINPIDTNLITKSYSQTRIPGNIQYTLNINPEGKDLSTGDTIDIQDLFETVKYFDHDFNGGETTEGKKLVDVLMNNIVLYEVDANGNKVKLNSSDYTLRFQSGADVSNGAALMQLTIPDEKHIVIEYVYKLIANEKTPSVIHGCKSSTRVNGRFATMAPGMVPPADDVITFSNTASLKSDSATATDSKKNTEYKVFTSSGMITTSALPSIKKVNTGDYSVDNLSAAFLLARYENGKWYYVTEAELTNPDKRQFTLTWGHSGMDGKRIDPDACKINVSGTEAFKTAFEENKLYKLVELEVPAQYEGSNLDLTPAQFEEMIRAYLNDEAVYYNGKDYSAFLRHYVSTHYFTYNSNVANLPAEVNAADVVQIRSGSDVEIPNNKLITLGADKEWVNLRGDEKNTEVTLELYWSFTKSSVGIPSEAIPARAEDLGIMDENYTAIKTIKVGEEANKTLWTNLPNGINKKPIYYYVKELQYTIGDTTYTLEETKEEVDGVTKVTSAQYKAPTGEIGPYLPTYSGNAANDDTVIGVRNSYQLMLKKAWKNSANVPMVNPPVDGVVVSIYGMNEDGQTQQPLIEGVELSVSNNWTADVTSLISGIDLSQYDSFVAVENENPALEGYVVSCVFNLNGQTGEIIVSNKNTAATEASVTVNKQWSDGNTRHANETIEVTLWRSLSEITNLTDLATKLSSMMNAGNAEIMKDADEQECRVTLGAENEWTHTWTGLPLEDEKQNKYYYYVLENKSGIADADKYSESYIITDKTPSRTEYTVKNYRNAIVVEKQWLGEDKIPFSTDDLKTLGIESITLDVMKEVALVPEDGLNIVAFGDSITDGYWQGSNPYPYQMTSILTGEDYGYTLTNLENGYIRKRGNSGWKIGSDKNNGLRSQISNQVTGDADIVCFIGGTNDIHQYDSGGNNAFINPTECMNRLKACIEEIQEHVTNEDMIVLVGSIPHFDFLKADGTSTTTGYDYWDYNGFKSKYESVALAEEAANDYIDRYNALIKAYAEETDGVYFVDVCSVVDKDTMSYDGCHPNNEGYAAIANAFAAAINEAYNQSSTVTQVTLTSQNNWSAAVDLDSTDPSIKYYINESNLPDGWTVSYTNNGQTAGSSTPITVTNTKYTPKTDIEVTKLWQNDASNTELRNGISLTLVRSTDNVTWEEVEVTMPTPSKKDNIWTYLYEDLPVEDGLGRTYYYKVEEDPLDGYTVTYDTQAVKAEDDGDAEKFQLTNTRAISINLKKIWSDGNGNHTSGSDKVNVRIYRIKGIAENTPQIPTESVDLIFQIPGTAAVGVNKDTTVTANKKIASAVSKDTAIAEVTGIEDNKLTIKGVAAGQTVILVKDENGTEREVTVTVSALTMYLDGSTTFTIVAGQEYTLSAKKGDDPVEAVFAVTNPENHSDLVTVNGTTIKANDFVTLPNNQKVKVSATYEGMTVEQELTIVLPDEFNIINLTSSDSNTVKVDERIELGIDKPYGTFVWEPDDSGRVEIVEENGKIYVVGKEVGSAVITAKRQDGETASVSVTVKEASITLSKKGDYFDILIESGKPVSSINFVFDTSTMQSGVHYQVGVIIYNGNSYVQNNYPGGNFTGQSSFSLTATFSGQTGTRVQVANNTDVSMTITSYEVIYQNTYSLHPTTSTPTSTAKLAKASSNAVVLDSIEFTPSTTNPAMEYYDIELVNTAEQNFEAVLNNLDVYASDGSPYYYWVEEISKHTGYTDSYLYTDGDGESHFWINASKPDTVTGGFEIQIANTKVESEGVTMPSTGGTGTRWYYIAGMMMMLVGVAGTIGLKRRQSSQR